MSSDSPNQFWSSGIEGDNEAEKGETEISSRTSPGRTPSTSQRNHEQNAWTSNTSRERNSSTTVASAHSISTLQTASASESAGIPPRLETEWLELINNFRTWEKMRDEYRADIKWYAHNRDVLQTRLDDTHQDLNIPFDELRKAEAMVRRRERELRLLGDEISMRFDRMGCEKQATLYGLWMSNEVQLPDTTATASDPLETRSENSTWQQDPENPDSTDWEGMEERESYTWFEDRDEYEEEDAPKSDHISPQENDFPVNTSGDVPRFGTVLLHPESEETMRMQPTKRRDTKPTLPETEWESVEENDAADEQPSHAPARSSRQNAKRPWTADAEKPSRKHLSRSKSRQPETQSATITTPPTVKAEPPETRNSREKRARR